MKYSASLIFSILLLQFTFAQQPSKPTSGEVFQQLKSLNFLGNVLYIAAHPDDENTAFISYFSNQVNARTAYLSLTRGDGGQNLIGNELGEELGLIRTQELLAARKIDNGEQFFSRAVDFGYSKTPKETLKIWDKEKILADVIYTIRKFRPDVIINRFDHRTSGSTHGHHTASAILSHEAFALAADENIYPKQLSEIEAWQPKRLFFNTSWYFYGSPEAFEKVDKSKYIKINTGVYYPLLGLSNNEIASLSRSQHQSQGFGQIGSRGDNMTYVEFIEGQEMQSDSLFGGINTKWSRLKDGKEIGQILYPLEEKFDHQKPWLIVPELIQAFKKIKEIDDLYWRNHKSNEIKNLIKSCLGLFIEAKAEKNYATLGEEIKIDLEAINRSPIQITLDSVDIQDQRATLIEPLKENQVLKSNLSIKIEDTLNYSSPYWLNQKPKNGTYYVNQQSLIGLPETPKQLKAEFIFDIIGEKISYQEDLIYKYKSPTLGEVYKNFKILPEVSIEMYPKTLNFNDTEEKEIQVTVKAFRNIEEASQIEIKTPIGWTINQQKIKINTLDEGESKSFKFRIKPNQNATSSSLEIEMKTGDKINNSVVKTIDYPHIPEQTIIRKSVVELNKFNIKTTDKKVAYIKGAGSVLPENLASIGIDIDVFNLEDINASLLQNYDVVITGLRLYNISKSIDFKQKILQDFIAKGGHLIIQYNTNRNLKIDNFKPFNFQISRDRVVDENAEMRILEPEHSVLHQPNKISDQDFENWVQERGLYFTDQWDKNLTPIFSMNDVDESPKKGSLLIGKYKKGHVTYTGISFFRQLPANVEGAYKLLVNLIAL
ncbi:PIG-L family deacetylase [Psychroflexus halocasei]|uniref:GlcNAc-PI de-N-acetylase n=1 Tax=Psychroflexus halocasei TaxID=908615 RepID=A0A1H3ZTD2_9FLAO|nr:PIG-L family deacetylase [Psychroflexus halocasei]SEA27016.1 GlcNAc-PI de-N-acetylase [Psychroflexus halocasei]